jgi:hypothetical protein
LFIRIHFSPRPQLVPAVSQLAAEFLRLADGDQDWLARVHMAAHELAENIAKYSTSAEVSLELALADEAGGRTLIIRTRNRATPERLLDVTRRLRELMIADNPDALYDEWLERSLAAEGVSGLGLARIRAEAGLCFEYTVREDELTIAVKAPVPKSQLDS